MAGKKMKSLVLLKVRKKENKLRKRTGQEYWWGAGDKKPERSPEINIFK